MELDEFLDLVITAKEGFFCLATGPAGSGDWYEQWYRWPMEKPQILAAVARARGESNVYFSTYLFKSPSSTKANVLPTRTIQADLDNADIDDLPIEPTVLVRTSPNRHQGYWVLASETVDPVTKKLVPNETLDPTVHEIISRKVTYSIKDCDPSGWPLGRKVRVPDTFNFKYLDGPKPIEVIATSRRTYAPEDFEGLPEAPGSSVGVEFDEFLDKAGAIKLDIGPQALLESLRTKTPSITPKVYLQYNVQAENRSDALWALINAAFRCGCTREEVFWLAKHSANNKFSSLRHGAERELAKDVLRAEAKFRTQGGDPKDVINQQRKLTPATVRKQTILKMVVDFMRQRGSFIHTTNENLWYIRRDIGRPVSVSLRSNYLDSLLDLEYGLNQTEIEHNYTVAGLGNYVNNLPAHGIQTALSYYDQATNVLLLHTGRRDVLRITPTSCDTIVDGSNGVIFPWNASTTPFVVAPADRADANWAEHLFGESAGQNALANVIGIKRPSALALLRVWFLFLLLRNVAISRPILATFGQPGSGKSTLFRKVYALIYGPSRSVGAVTTQEDFDHGVATDPFVVLDNVDTWERWLPDRLALSASTSDIVRRRLYTDSDIVVLKRQALVGITAHNPRFGREDVADRLLLLSFERLDHFIPEQLILDGIASQRSAIWGGVVADIQKVLATPIPDMGPQFRVEDFARIGIWVATALGIATEFTEGLGHVRLGQRSFSLEEDAILVSALRNLVAQQGGSLTGFSVGKLWAMLEPMSGDPQAFTRVYRNSVTLGRKLKVLQDALRLAYDMESVFDPTIQSLVWNIKEHVNGTS